MNYNDHSYNECADILCNNVLKTIKTKCDENNLSQGRLSSLTGIAQPTISKIFSGEIKMSISHIAKFCKSLNIDPGEVVTFNNEKTQTISNDEYKSDGIFAINPSHWAFRGYFGKYNVYFKSTISTEENILHGVLEFSPSKDNKSCVADLLLYTGKNKEGNKITKHYTGELLISLSMSSCYCTLISQELGEMCFFVFDYMSINTEDLVSRMACALTTSAGGNRCPTMHRLLICKDELDISNKESEDFKFLSGHLKLNSSDIIISESKLSEIENCEKRSDIKDVIKKLEKNSEMESFYKIDESLIRKAQYDIDTMIDVISILRNYSIAGFNNKISSKSDEYVYNYLQKRDD